MRQGYLALLAVLILAGCAGNRSDFRNQQQLPELDDLGPAPELYNEIWLNTDQPLRLENLRGNVVLLDMWTFG